VQNVDFVDFKKAKELEIDVSSTNPNAKTKHTNRNLELFSDNSVKLNNPLSGNLSNVMAGPFSPTNWGDEDIPTAGTKVFAFEQIDEESQSPKTKDQPIFFNDMPDFADQYFFKLFMM
jgi:hypothetical protein